MSHPSHRITAESILNMRFNERLALEMITVMLWPLAADERIGLLLTTLAIMIRDVAETDEESMPSSSGCAYTSSSNVIVTVAGE